MNKSSITDSIIHNSAGNRTDLYNSLPIEKILTFHNVITFIKPVANVIKNHYYYNIFLEKGLYKDTSIHDIFKWMFVYYKCYISSELTFLKELMLVKQVHQTSVAFITIGFS